MKLGIVVSEFNYDITHRMLDYALKKAKKLGVSTVVSHVSGAFDIPLAVKKLLKRKDVSGVATLGAIIQGETDHDVLIATTCAHALTNLSLEFEKPVSLGVLGPRITRKQAEARMKEYAERAVEAALQH
ncbi:MAG: 6,7-dimethyl-8-ribityllumazine synthase [Nanoarchaeota archaeon]|nr:6,7-dimethyl-8-ribityllumazine synthase [Nanoarchaeota archaeon]